MKEVFLILTASLYETAAVKLFGPVQAKRLCLVARQLGQDNIKKILTLADVCENSETLKLWMRQVFAQQERLWQKPSL
jgi:hypothetical protein